MAMANTLSAEGPQSKWLTLRQLLQSSIALPASAILVEGAAADHSKLPAPPCPHAPPPRPAHA